MLRKAKLILVALALVVMLATAAVVYSGSFDHQPDAVAGCGGCPF